VQRTHENYWGIWVTNAFIQNNANLTGGSPIVYQWTYNASYFVHLFLGKGAGFVAGPVTGRHGISHIFARCLAGREGWQYRDAADAAVKSAQINGDDDYHAGNGDTTLAPTLRYWAPVDRVWWEDDLVLHFDTNLNTNGAPEDLVEVTGDAHIDMGRGVYWVGSTSIWAVLVADNPAGSAQVHVKADKAVSLNNGSKLDGGTPASNAVGPNSDDFAWEIPGEQFGFTGCPLE
jgi:hypothetical protein